MGRKARTTVTVDISQRFFVFGAPCLIEGGVVIDSGSVMVWHLGVAQHSASHRIPRPRPCGRWEWTSLVVLALVGACSRRENAKATVTSGPKIADSSSPREESPDFDPQRVFSVGQKAAGKGYTVRALRVLECRGREGWRPEPGQLFLGVELEARETSGNSIAIGHSHAKLLDQHGRALAAEPYVKTENCEPLLKYTRLNPHGSVTGWVVFSIPGYSHSLKLRVAPRAFLHEPPLLFDLGR